MLHSGPLKLFGRQVVKKFVIDLKKAVGQIFLIGLAKDEHTFGKRFFIHALSLKNFLMF